MSAVIIPFPNRPLGEEVEDAWCTHRAFCRAEMADPALLEDPAHVRASQRAKDEFDRLYEAWSRM